MVQELLVDFQQPVVRTKNVLKFDELYFLLLEEQAKKGFQTRSIPEGNGFNEVELNGGGGHKCITLSLVRGRGPLSYDANLLQMKRLSELEPGTIARIHSFEKNDLFLKLMEMGCVPGELIKVEQVAPLGDPISITVAGYNLSLRLDEADNIFMEEGGK